MAKNSIESLVLDQTHTNIPEQMARRKTIIVPHDMMDDLEARQLEPIGDSRIRCTEDGRITINRYMDTDIQVRLPKFTPSTDIGFDSVEVKKKLWPTIPDIETAIRYTRHIADSYDRKDGSETLSLLSLNNLVKTVCAELQKPKSERMSRETLEELVNAVVVRSGFETARDLQKKETADLILRAIGKDSMNRENNSRTRFMMAHAIPRITKQLLENRGKYNKYRYLESVLHERRSLDQMPFLILSNQAKRLEKMISTNDRNALILKKQIRLTAYQLLSPDKIKTAPYVQLAAEARFRLTAHPPLDERRAGEILKLTRYVGKDIAQEIAEYPSYYDLDNDEQCEVIFDIFKKTDHALELQDQELPKDLDAAA